MIREIQRSKEEWRHMSGQIWLAWTIFNPLGPTLACVGAGRVSDQSDSFEIFFRWMHLLGGRTYVIGHLAAASAKDEFLRVMLNAFEVPVLPGDSATPMISAVPSAISLGKTPIEQSLVLMDLFKRAPAIRQADWGRERYFLTKYKLDLFARAGEEAREGYEAAKKRPENFLADGGLSLRLTESRFSAVPTFHDWEPNAYTPRAYDENEFEEWWEAVTSKAYLEPALAQFAQAWVGAAYRTGSPLPIVEELEDARDFMAQMNHPLWAADCTTELLLKAVPDGRDKVIVG